MNPLESKAKEIQIQDGVEYLKIRYVYIGKLDAIKMLVSDMNMDVKSALSAWKIAYEYED